jgi:hypothetical protein
MYNFTNTTGINPCLYPQTKNGSRKIMQKKEPNIHEKKGDNQMNACHWFYIPSIGIVTKPHEVHAYMYVIATIMACLDAQVSALENVGIGQNHLVNK